MFENLLKIPEETQESLKKFVDDYRKLEADLSEMNPLETLDESTLESVRGMIRGEEIVKEMGDSLFQEIREKHEQKRLQNEANQAMIDSLPVQKESLAVQKQGIRVSLLSAVLGAVVSAVLGFVLGLSIR